MPFNGVIAQHNVLRNRNTRMAYYRAACSFFAWVERHRIGELADIEPVHVAAI